MKAIVVHEFGGPEVLKYEDTPKPAPKENEMLIRVIAAGVNPVDDGLRSGHYSKYFGPKPPFTPGSDIAGVVEKTGVQITKLKVGDAVYAYLDLDRGGGYAEYALANEKEAALKPNSLTFEEAAATPIVALTAWQALIDTAKLSPGQTVLIHGGSGGVGTFAIQIAKASRRKSSRDRIHAEPGPAQTTRGRRSNRLYETKVRGRGERCRCCARLRRQRHITAILRRREKRRVHCHAGSESGSSRIGETWHSRLGSECRTKFTASSPKSRS